jgi:hypothetical protein
MFALLAATGFRDEICYLPLACVAKFRRFLFASWYLICLLVRSLPGVTNGRIFQIVGYYAQNNLFRNCVNLIACRY